MDHAVTDRAGEQQLKRLAESYRENFPTKSDDFSTQEMSYDYAGGNLLKKMVGFLRL